MCLIFLCAPLLCRIFSALAGWEGVFARHDNWSWVPVVADHVGGALGGLVSVGGGGGGQPAGAGPTDDAPLTSSRLSSDTPEIFVAKAPTGRASRAPKRARKMCVRNSRTCSDRASPFLQCRRWWLVGREHLVTPRFLFFFSPPPPLSSTC